MRYVRRRGVYQYVRRRYVRHTSRYVRRRYVRRRYVRHRLVPHELELVFSSNLGSDGRERRLSLCVGTVSSPNNSLFGYLLVVRGRYTVPLRVSVVLWKF